MHRYILAIIILPLLSCGPTGFNPKWTEEKAPETYKVQFETTKGTFDIEVYRAWSPAAADRLYQLVRHDYFNHAVFYRVVPDFVAQFTSSNLILKEQWMAYPVPDEPVLQANTRGRITFARGGQDNRGSDLFINLRDNPKLDTTEYLGVTGYPPLGEVIRGMDVVDQMYDVYGEDLMQEMDRFYTNRNAFMQAYPGLDVVKKATIIK